MAEIATSIYSIYSIYLKVTVYGIQPYQN